MHRHYRRLQHHQQQVRPVPDERDLFSHDTDLRYRNEYLPRLFGGE
jgi:hypothetical protein